jgi:hypothetical protein
MGKLKKRESAQAANIFQFSLAGLIIFSLALMGGASLVVYRLADSRRPDLQADTYAVNPKDKTRSVHVGPWGELITRDIELERPAEYLTEEVATPRPEIWAFAGKDIAAVKGLLASKGLNAAQLDGAMKLARETAAGTELVPTLDFLLSLDSDTRARLCLGLAGANAYLYFDYPYIFPDGNISSIYDDERLNPDDVKLFKKLVYNNGTAQQLSDYDALLSAIPTVERRVALTRAMSRQSAVFAGLVIKPDTDIDKLAAYWGHLPNVRFTDIRPLMEALKALPEGGNLSLFYLLPKFARDRLYTFPLPPQTGEPTMDCHWTTFNFCNEVPDNRFNDPNYAVQYIRDNFYQIAAPSFCGDILLLMNDRNEIKHSAVYLADDIVFTKNGNNYRQPWMLMHIPDLLATYPNTPPMRAIYMRRKTD